MKQKTTAQLREEIRKDLVKKLEKKYQWIQDDVEKYKKLYRDEYQRNVTICHKLSDIKQENEELKDKLQQYKDWVERLQDFMDIKDDEERKQAFETYIKERQSKAELNDLINVYCNMFNRLFSF